MADAGAIHREMLEAVNQHDLVRLRETLHEDYTYRGADGSEAKGPDAGVGQVEPFIKGFPDLHIRIDRQLVAGDTSIIEATATGTQTGDLGPIPASDRYAEVAVCDIIEVRDGKIVAEREYYNEMSLMQQLGVIPTE